MTNISGFAGAGHSYELPRETALLGKLKRRHEVQETVRKLTDQIHSAKDEMEASKSLVERGCQHLLLGTAKEADEALKDFEAARKHASPEVIANLTARALKLKEAGSTDETECLSKEDLEILLKLNTLCPHQMARFNNMNLTSEQMAKLMPMFTWVYDESSTMILGSGGQHLERALKYLELPIMKEFLLNISSDPKTNQEDFFLLFGIDLPPFLDVNPDTMTRAFSRVLGSSTLAELNLAGQFNDLLKMPLEALQALTKWVQDKPALVAKSFAARFIDLLQTDTGRKRLDAIKIAGETQSDTFKRILRVSESLMKRFPNIVSKLSLILQENLPLLISLHHLSARMPPDAFNYLFEHYIGAGASSGETALGKPWIDKLLKDFGDNSETRAKFEAFINRERELGHPLLPLLVLHPNLLNEPLFDAIMNNAAFARQVNVSNVSSYTALNNMLRSNEREVYQLFDIAGHDPKVISEVLSTLGLSTVSTAVSRVFNEALKLRQANAPLAEALITLIGHGKAEVAEKLLQLPNEELRMRLVIVINSSEINLVENLLRAPAKDEFIQRLLAQTNVDTIPLIRGLLATWASGRPEALLKMLAQQPPSTPFSAMDSALLALHVQGEEVVLKASFEALSKPRTDRSFEENRLLAMVEEHRFVLARDSIERADEAFWKAASTSIDTSSMQQLRDLNLSLGQMANPPRSWSAAELRSMQQIALQIVRHKEPAEAESWMGVIQFYLHHDPDLVQKKIHSSSWQSLLSNTLEQKELSMRLDEVFNEVSILSKSIREGFEYRGEMVRKQNPESPLIGFLISDYLLTVGGTINHGLLKSLFQTSFIRSGNPYIKRVLEAFRDDTAFSDRLESLRTLPSPGTRAHALLQAASGTSDPVTRRSAQIAVLRALLWPLRQSRAGSCFATAIVLQMDSNREGLKQGLEDLLSIVTRGYIVRPRIVSGKNWGNVQYPITFDAAAQAHLFGSDPFLPRVREFTMASTAGDAAGTQVFADRNKERFQKLFSDHLAKFTSGLPPDEFLNLTLALINSDCPSLLTGNLIGADFTVRYFGYLRAPGNDTVGAWVMVNPATGEPLTSNPEAFQKFFLDSWEREIQKIPTGGNPATQALVNSLREHLNDYIRSDQFIKDFFNVPAATSAPFGVTAPALVRNPMVDFTGGDNVPVMKRCYPGSLVQTRALPAGQNSLERLFHYVLNLSEAEKKAARENPHLLKTIQYNSLSQSGHAMNIPIGRLVPLLDRAGTPASLVENLQKANKSLGETALTPALQEQILKFYSTLLRNHLNNAGAILKEALESARPPPRTLRELGELIVQTTVLATRNPEFVQIAKSAFQRVVFAIKELRERMPEPYIVADTNHSGLEAIAFGLDLFGDGLTPYYAYRTGEPFVTSMIPYPVSRWTVHEINNRIDEFSTTYHT